MTVRFDTYESKDLPALVYTNVISVYFDDNMWYITYRTKHTYVKNTELKLDDYAISYVHI